MIYRPRRTGADMYESLAAVARPWEVCMQIKWFDEGRGRTLARIAAALSFAAQLAAGIWQGLALPANIVLALLLAGLMYFAFGARVTVKRWWGAVIELGFISVASVVLLHLVLIQWMDTESTLLLKAKIAFFNLTYITPPGIMRGTCIAMIILCVVFLLTANIKWFGSVWLMLNYAFCLLDAAIYEFSGNVITVSDITAVDTALNVADNYQLQIVPLMVTHLILFIACMAVTLRTREDRTQLKQLRVRLVALACIVISLPMPVLTLMHRKPSTFEFNGIRRHSILMEFAMEIALSDLKKPEAYSPDTVTQLAERYPGTPASVPEGQRPHVIAIMVEALSDLTVLGDLRTDVDFMPYTRQLMQESVSGQALVSTFGGGTARSEWEFLTGNTMGFMPDNCMPFRQYITDDENSLVKVFENAGYHSIGMHPARGNGWGRSDVYPAMGFDETYFIDDLDWGEYERGYISDHAFVQQVIHLFEERGSEPLFLFGVTIQDHGNYKYEGYPSTVHIEGLNGQFPDAEQYLTLIKKTDDAIRELIEYFSSVDEPVQIIFFGDHQPWLESDIYTALGTKSVGQKFLVPFVMWDNYAHRVESVPMTSVNFLPARLLDLVGIQKPAYYSFLSALNERVDAMNHLGYIVDGKSYDYDDKSSVTDLLQAYRIYQYANMFDPSVDERLFIGGSD